MIIRQIRQASSAEYFNGELNLRMGRRFRQLRNGGFSWAKPCFSWPQLENERSKTLDGPMDHYWEIGGGGICHSSFLGAYVEVDLEDIRSTSRILDGIGCGGALKLHLPRTKHPLHLVDSQALIFLVGMRNGISNRNKTTLSNTDTRLNPKEFYEKDTNRRMPIHEMGVEAFNDCMGHLSAVEERRRDEGTPEEITALESLMSGQRVEKQFAG